jgi:hypothetical protein
MGEWAGAGVFIPRRYNDASDDCNGLLTGSALVEVADFHR